MKSSKVDRSRSEASGRTAVPSRSKSVYADGVALDRVQYLEAKLILKPDRFRSVESFREFGKIVRKVAKQTDVGFTKDPRADATPEIREIIFLDTPDFALYRNAFILRRRISYVDGFAQGDPEIVFKFRHPDEEQATEMDVRPRIKGKHRIKFKAEALPLKDKVGGYRLLYSHNAQFGLSQIRQKDKTSMVTLDQVLPPLTRLKREGGKRVALVNGGIVEEVLLPLGQLDFGKGLVGKCDIGLWRTRGEHLPLVGEFAFQVKFDRKEDIAETQRARAIRFYLALQHEVEGWLALGVTKTAMVYGLHGAGPSSHE